MFIIRTNFELQISNDKSLLNKQIWFKAFKFLTKNLGMILKIQVFILFAKFESLFESLKFEFYKHIFLWDLKDCLKVWIQIWDFLNKYQFLLSSNFPHFGIFSISTFQHYNWVSYEKWGCHTWKHLLLDPMKNKGLIGKKKAKEQHAAVKWFSSRKCLDGCIGKYVGQEERVWKLERIEKNVMIIFFCTRIANAWWWRLWKRERLRKIWLYNKKYWWPRGFRKEKAWRENGFTKEKLDEKTQLDLKKLELQERQLDDKVYGTKWDEWGTTTILRMQEEILARRFGGGSR
jgi:hypothetical protein